MGHEFLIFEIQSIAKENRGRNELDGGGYDKIEILALRLRHKEKANYAKQCRHIG
jgi:hypothetical protein